MMEMKIILSIILSRFQLSTKQTVEDLGKIPQLVVKAKNGVWINFEQRKY